MTDSFACIANGTDERFTHQGINCMVQMGPFSINGYIELPDNHPWLDEAEDLQFFDGVDVHGGLTYHKGRVIGFDTNHAGDEPHPSSEFGYLTRGISTLSMFGEIPRSWTWEEVEEETRRLAEQAANALKEHPTMTDRFTQFRHHYGKWCSWQTQVHSKDGTSFTRTEYGIIIPDDTAASLGCLTVMDIQPGDITIDYDVDPSTITILDDVPPAFYGGWASWTHPNDRTKPNRGDQ